MKLKVGNKLMFVREDRKMTQSEMADFLGLSQSAYSRIERNEVSAELEDLFSYARKLNVPIQEFLPETMAIHNNSDNGQVGFVIGNFYNYGDKELEHQNEILKEKVKQLESRVKDLEELNSLLRNAK
jgi:transcriptional regulator with XRE-family HTH domain